MQNFPQNYAFERSWKVVTIMHDSHLPLPRVLHLWECLPLGSLLRIKKYMTKKKKKGISSAAEATCPQVTAVKVVLTVTTGVKIVSREYQVEHKKCLLQYLITLMWIPRNIWERGVLEEQSYMSKQMRITLELEMLLLKWHYLYF